MGNSNHAANEVTRGVAFMGDIMVKYGQVVKALVGTVARTNTAAKPLGLLPAGATILSVKYVGAADSDAATTATLSLGYDGGSGAELISAADVKGSGRGTFDVAPPVANVADRKLVTGIYAETGQASTTGGPWTVIVEYLSNVAPGF